MAVYERTYRPYTGRVTAQRTRFLILPRYSYREAFRSRLFGVFLVACFLMPLRDALLIYLPYNLKVVEYFGGQAGDLLSFFGYEPASGGYDAMFFFRGLIRQSVMAYLAALALGPTLISVDLRNNGLPLYLSRPFSRTEYVLGKATVLIVLLSAITWMPELLLFLFQAYLGGLKWLKLYSTLGLAIFVGSWIWIAILCLISLAVSAYVKWKPLAWLLLFMLFFIGGFGELINQMYRTNWGSLINILKMIGVVWTGLFRIENETGVPIWAAWISLLAVCAISILLLSRKIRAYEVVR